MLKINGQLQSPAIDRVGEVPHCLRNTEINLACDAALARRGVTNRWGGFRERNQAEFVAFKAKRKQKQNAHPIRRAVA